MLAILYQLYFFFSDDFIPIGQASASVGTGGPLDEVQKQVDRDREALARAAAWAEQLLDSGFMPNCAWASDRGTCSLNATWAESMVTSTTAKLVMQRRLMCNSHDSQESCSADTFCDWAEDVSKCDVEVEHTLGEALFSTILSPSTLTAATGAQTSGSYTSVCGFGAELRAWYASCASTPLGSFCPSHCKPAESKCTYRSGECRELSRCELNATSFWHAACGSDMGGRCGVKLASWSSAQIQGNESWQQAVECLQRSCPSAANHWRRVFFLREHCTSLNTSDLCVADERCDIRRDLAQMSFMNGTLVDAISCEPKPGEFAPKGCTFGEFADAAWDCKNTNRSSCIGNCHFINGGICWHRIHEGRGTQINQCFSAPSSKLRLREETNPSKCVMTSSYGLQVLAATSKKPELEMLARLIDHQAHCEKLDNRDTCEQPPPVVYGEVEMNVSWPETFSQDPSAREAVAKAIAVLAHVSTTVRVRMSMPRRIRRLETNVIPDPIRSRVNIMQRRASVALKRAGLVNADYTIYVPPEQTVEGVLNSLQNTGNAAATREVVKALQTAKLSKTYLVEVKHITASSKAFHQGKQANQASGMLVSVLLSAIFFATWSTVGLRSA